MRLIEAETLKSAIREKFPSLADRCEINEVVNSAQTIDAIPLDWLREKMRGYASALKSTEMDAVVRVMCMWEREQEAR